MTRKPPALTPKRLLAGPELGCALLLILLLGLAGLVGIDRWRIGNTTLGIQSESGALGPWLYVDGNGRPAADAPIALSGYLLAPRQGDYLFSLPGAAAAELSVAGVDVFTDGPAGAIGLSQGAHPFQLSIPASEAENALRLWWQPPGGLAQPVPLGATFREAPSPADLRAGQVYRAGRALAFLLVGLGMGGLTVLGFRQPVGSRPRVALLITAGLLVLAVGTRLIFVQHRAAHDPEFFTQRPGSDQLDYELSARRLARGEAAIEGPHFKQPGVRYLTYGTMLVAGPEITARRMLVAGLSGLSMLIVVNLGRQVFDDPRPGWLAGLLFALYPAAIFYSGTGLVEAYALLLSLLVLWRTLALIEHPTWPEALLLGLLLGVTAITRQNLMTFFPFGLAIFVWLAEASWRRKAMLIAVTVAACALVILPFSLHNRAAGSTALIATAGDMLFYMGNNRNATGYYILSQDMQITRRLGLPYRETLLEEIRAEPLRYVEFLIYKTGMFWQADELVTNLSYEPSGPGASWLLRLLRGFTLPLLSVPALAGLVLALQRGKRKTWLLVAFVLMGVATAVAFTPESRLRAPVIAGLLPAAGYTLVQAGDALKGPRTLAQVRQVGLWLLVFTLLLAGLDIARRTLPRPRLLAESRLPESVQQVDAIFGESIHLHGYEIIRGDEEGAAPGGIIVLRLYWEALAPLDTDYSVFAHLRGPDGLSTAGQGDARLGLVSFPPYPTSKWRTGRVFAEDLLVEVSPDAVTPQGAGLYLGIYDEKTGERLPLPGQPDGAIYLGSIRVADQALRQPITPENSLDVMVEDWAQLAGYMIRVSDEALQLELIWEVVNRPPENYHVFVHVLDGAGELQAQGDGVPLEGRFPTGQWRAGDWLRDPYRVDVSGLAVGTYSLRVGLYDPATGLRARLSEASQPLLDNALVIEGIRLD